MSIHLQKITKNNVQDLQEVSIQTFTETFKDNNSEKSLNDYKFPINYNEVCLKCENQKCKKGCYAAKISRGSKLAEKDYDLCPLEDA